MGEPSTGRCVRGNLNRSGGTFFSVRIRNMKEILDIGVCGETSVGPGELFSSAGFEI